MSLLEKETIRYYLETEINPKYYRSNVSIELSHSEIPLMKQYSSFLTRVAKIQTNKDGLNWGCIVYYIWYSLNCSLVLENQISVI